MSRYDNMVVEKKMEKMIINGVVAAASVAAIGVLNYGLL